EYTTRRRWPGGRGVSSRVVVSPEPNVLRGDSLAHFLTARWGLHTRWVRRSLFVPNDHPTWPLQTATLRHLDDDLVAAAGLPGISDKEPDSVLYSAGVRAVFGVPIDSRRQPTHSP
ncbi:MAG: DUF2071 domain-containing protein, partial [Nocardioidaceae bacterium]